MIITNETKERFVKMLDKRQIIVIRASVINRKYPHFKIIGADEFGRWDLTPCVSYITDCKTIPVTGGEIAICGTLDVVGVLQDALRKLYEERIESDFFKNNTDCGYSLYSYCSEHICTFHL